MFVCGIIGDKSRRATLQQVLSDSLRCELFAEPKALFELLEREQPDCLLVAPWDDLGNSTAPTVERARKLLPCVPIIVYCKLDPRVLDELLDLGRAGASTVMLDSTSRAPSVIVKAVRVAQNRAVLEASFALVEQKLPEPARPFVRYVLRNVGKDLHVRGVARGLGMHRNTLAKHFRGARLPFPRHILPKLRLLSAAHLLETTGRSVNATARALHFGEGANLSAAFRRHFGLTASEAATIGIVSLRQRVIDFVKSGADRSRSTKRGASVRPDSTRKRKRAAG